MRLHRSLASSHVNSPLKKSAYRYQKQANAWESTVEEIRQLEGFESFLLATPFATLQKAAMGGPVIMVNISQY